MQERNETKGSFDTLGVVKTLIARLIWGSGDSSDLDVSQNCIPAVLHVFVTVTRASVILVDLLPRPKTTSLRKDNVAKHIFIQHLSRFLVLM